MGIAKVTRHFQVTIPKDVREFRKLKSGDNVIFSIEGNRVDILKADKNVLLDAAGLWKTSKETGAEYERKLRKGWSSRLKRNL